jgi:hypothetical protein
MVQKVDKDAKKSITPSTDSTKNQSSQMNKHSNKSSKNAPKRNDPSGLPKYR